MNEREIYSAAARLADGSERETFLAEACGDDDALRNRIFKLLAARSHREDNLLADAAPASGGLAITENGSPLSSPVSNEGDSTSAPPEIDRYRIIEEIGQGGMGTVYMAEQRKPVRRKVALKVIKRGMDSEQVVARFEAERQALALMNHPNIAGVLDAGMTDDGRPFFVMELVRGIPITEYCDRHKLSRDDRLKLFKSVCNAVQHAHQKGVIHRDLKPSNILVELHDVNHVPKVIDFGVAKATSQRLTDKTLYTLFSQMIGTPLYMSPEQAELSGLDVDTRSDIYSLGVLLYELLTGTTPFDRETFKAVSLDEMRRIIREDEPLRPSQKISTLDKEQVSTIAERQSTDVRSLTGRPVQELDWIVGKTLEKDRSRRYESASALAGDIDRYLANEPVLACPPSVGYRLSKFASKRKGVLVSAGLVMLSLIGATAISLWSAANAREAATASKKSAELADRRFQLALESVDKFLSEVTDNEKLKNESLESLRLDLLQSAIPFLEQLVEEDSGDTGAMVAKAEALLRLGQIQNELGNQAEALELLDSIPSIIEILRVSEIKQDEFRALEAKYYSQSGSIQYALGNLQQSYDHHQNSVLIQKEVVERAPTVERQANLARYLTRTANVANYFDRAEQAMEFIDQAIAIWEHVCEQKPDNELYATRKNSSRIIKASVFQYQDDFEAAIAENEKVVQELSELTKRFPENMNIQENLQVAHSNLGINLEEVGRFDEAIEQLSRALELDRLYLQKFPEIQNASLGWANTAQALAGSLLLNGQVEESITQLQEVVEVLAPLSIESADQPMILRQLSDTHFKLAKAAEKAGNLTDAQLQFERSIQTLDSLIAQFPETPRYRNSLAASLLNRGGLMFRMGKFEAAAEDLTRAIEVMQPLVPLFDSRPSYGKRLATIHGNLGVLMQRLKREQEKQFHWQKRIELLEQLAKNNPDDRELRHSYAIAAGSLGDGPRSLQLIEALMRDFPEARTQYLENHAQLLHELGARSDKSLSEQKASYERAVASLREYLATFPAEVSGRLELTTYLTDLAIVAAKLQDGELYERVVSESIAAFTAASQRISPSNPQVIELCRTCIGDLAELLGSSKTRPLGQLALSRWEQVVAPFEEDSSRYAGLGKTLAAAQEATSKSDVTILLEQEKLEHLKIEPEENAKEIADTLNSLGMMYLSKRDYDAARTTLEKSVAVSTDAYGALHPSTLSHSYDLGLLESTVNEHNAALAIFREVLDKRTKVLGIEHFDTFKAEERIFLALASLKHFDEAGDFMRERETLQSDSGKPDQRRSAFRLKYIATAETELKNFDNAIAAYKQSDAIYEKLNSHAATLDRLLMLNKYGMLLKELRRRDSAIQVFQEIIAIREQMQKERPTDLFNRRMLGGAHGNLSNVFLAQDDYQKAAEELERAQAVFSAILVENPSDRFTQKFQASVLRNMATCYEYLEMPEEAINFFKRASAICMEDQRRELELRYALARIRFAAKGLEGGSYAAPVEVALKYLGAEKDELEDREFFFAASILAMAASFDDVFTDEQQQRYRQNAMQALQRSAELGYFASPLNRDKFRAEEFASLNEDAKFTRFLNKHDLPNAETAEEAE